MKAVKTHRIADCLEVAARILRSLPDSDLLEVLEKIEGTLVRKEASSPLIRSTREQLPLNVDAAIDHMATMSPSDLETYLRSSEKFSTVTSLRELAKRLGLTTSRQQGHAALINLIVKHREARRTNSIIRSRIDGNKDSVVQEHVPVASEQEKPADDTLPLRTPKE